MSRQKVKKLRVHRLTEVGSRQGVVTPIWTFTRLGEVDYWFVKWGTDRKGPNGKSSQSIQNENSNERL